MTASLLALALTVATAAQPAPPFAVRLLFIGNSLTASNDLPTRVCRILHEAGVDAVCESETAPGTALSDHWRSPARERLEEQWDFVILQQGPSAMPESRILLTSAARQWAGAIRAAGATPVLLSVWPSEARSFDFAGVASSYAHAAAASGSRLVPAGSAWQAAWKADRERDLYSEDRFHPSIEGSELAAGCVAVRLFGDRVRIEDEALRVCGEGSGDRLRRRGR